MVLGQSRSPSLLFLKPLKLALCPWKLKKVASSWRLGSPGCFSWKHAFSVWNDWTFQMFFFFSSSQKSALKKNALNHLFCLYFFLYICRRGIHILKFISKVSESSVSNRTVMIWMTEKHFKRVINLI